MYATHFNISSRKLDVDKLNREMDRAEKDADSLCDFYIFASSDTLNDIGDDLYGNYKSGYGWYMMYRGHRVFTDVTKEYGEIEFR